MKKIVKANSLDLWICHHFKVLPTDDRFKKLTNNQKDLLLAGFIENPTDKEIIQYHRNIEKEIVNEDDIEAFREGGYTEDQIERIQKNIQIAMAAMGES